MDDVFCTVYLGYGGQEICPLFLRRVALPGARAFFLGSFCLLAFEGRSNEIVSYLFQYFKHAVDDALVVLIVIRTTDAGFFIREILVLHLHDFRL